jgi:hypothetical protein
MEKTVQQVNGNGNKNGHSNGNGNGSKVPVETEKATETRLNQILTDKMGIIEPDTQKNLKSILDLVPKDKRESAEEAVFVLLRAAEKIGLERGRLLRHGT